MWFVSPARRRELLAPPTCGGRVLSDFAQFGEPPEGIELVIRKPGTTTGPTAGEASRPGRTLRRWPWSAHGQFGHPPEEPGRNPAGVQGVGVAWRQYTTATDPKARSGRSRRIGTWARLIERCFGPERAARQDLAGLMKTGTGSAIRCIDASAQALLVAVPVPLFISPGSGCGPLQVHCQGHRERAPLAAKP